MLLAAAVLALVALSPFVGRADPTGNYRPALVPDALTNGCWPLPGDVQLDFGYQVRTDDVITTGDGERRQVVLHYDEISGAQALARVQDAFAAAGLGDDVQVRVTDFDQPSSDALVRGQMVLSLPPTLPDGRAECRDPFSTKLFTHDMDDRS